MLFAAQPADPYAVSTVKLHVTQRHDAHDNQKEDP